MATQINDELTQYENTGSLDVFGQSYFIAYPSPKSVGNTSPQLAALLISGESGESEASLSTLAIRCLYEFFTNELNYDRVKDLHMFMGRWKHQYQLNTLDCCEDAFVKTIKFFSSANSNFSPSRHCILQISAHCWV